MRYMLFYSDDFVSDWSKMEAQIKFDHKGQMVYDQELIVSPVFKKFLVNTGCFFSVDVSPMTPISISSRSQGCFGAHADVIIDQDL